MKLPYFKLEEICEKYEIKLMVLFGSYGTDKFDSNSDIDFGIQAKNLNLIKQNQLTLINEISSLFEYHNIDIVLLNHADSLLKFQIAQKGKLIYEAKQNLFATFKVKAMKEHNDAQKRFYPLDKKSIHQYLEGKGAHGRSKPNPPEIK